MTPHNMGRTVVDMQTVTTTVHKSMPKTSAAAVQRVRLLLADLALLPLGSTYNVGHASTGRHLDRVVVSVPLNRLTEAQHWYQKIVPALPWACRVTLVPEIGRIEIEPRGR